jgi:hypothetical protein
MGAGRTPQRLSGYKLPLWANLLSRLILKRHIQTFCQSQSKKGPQSRGKKGPFWVMFVWRFSARARHKAEACQSACWPSGRHCSELGGAGLFPGFATVFEAIAFAVHLKDVDVMGQTVQ